MLAPRRRFVASGFWALASAALSTARARGAQVELKAGSMLPADHPSTLRLMQMFAAIERESGNRIHTQIFPNNILGNESAMFTQLRVGALQFMAIGPGFFASVVPVADISNVGFAFKDEDEAMRVMSGPVGTYVRDQAASKGIHAFSPMWNAGMYAIGSNTRPIRTPDDLHGFKIRVAGKIAVDLFKELGANPTTITVDEVYTGLQTKLIDGEAAPLVIIDTMHLWEVHKYLSLTNHAWIGEWVIANQEAWAGLAPDLQSIVERNHAKYAELARKDIRAFNASLVGKLRTEGETVNLVDQAPFRALLRSYYQTWAGNMGATAWGLLESSIGRKLS